MSFPSRDGRLKKLESETQYIVDYKYVNISSYAVLDKELD